jgi:hypothetical protein
MLNYIPFYTHIWSDAKFKRLSDADNQILFIYLIGNPAINLTGIYEIDFEFCPVRKKLRRPFDEVFDELVKSQMVKWDSENEIIFVVNRFKAMMKMSTSPKIITGAINELNQMSHRFRQDFIEKYKPDIKNFLWQLKESKITTDEILTDEFIVNVSKIYSSKQALKNFVMNRGVSERRIDEVISRVLPNLK